MSVRGAHLLNTEKKATVGSEATLHASDGLSAREQRQMEQV